jgi:hypothetical protein
MINGYQLLEYNYTNSTDYKGPIFNATAWLSYSVAGFINNCPVMAVDLAYNLTNQYKQFDNATFAQITESFMFGMMTNSIEFRSVFLSLEEMADNGTTDNVVIVG